MKTDRWAMPRAAALIAAMLASAAAQAQSWPVKPVRVIVPFAPGGGSDIQGRLLGRKFQEATGQPFVLDNRAGASGLIGAELAAKSPPDGYTVLITTASLSVNVNLFRKIAFDPLKELQPVTLISSTPLVLAVHPGVPAKSVKELAALTKRQKGGLNGASAGAGTTGHLSLEMFRQLAGADLTHIPYKGGSIAMLALITGEVDFEFNTALVTQPHVKSGKVRALAVTTSKQSPAFPGLPTMTSIYPGFESDNWYGMFLPGGTPREIVARLNAEMVKAVNAPDVRDFIMKEGGDPVGSSVEEFSAYFKHEIGRYAKIVRAGNISAE